MDEISLNGMIVECIVGIYPHERKTLQPVEVNLRLALDTRSAGKTGKIGATVDYAEIGGEVRFLLESCRFLLVETACEAIASYLLAPPISGKKRAQVEAVSIEMKKLDKVVNSGVPGVSIERRRGEMSYGLETREFGTVDVVFAARECGVYRLRIVPGGSIGTHVHRIMDESEMILTDGLHLQERPIGRGEAHRWPKDFPHRYDNPTDVEQTILCVDCPAFIPSDEIFVDEPPGDLADVFHHDYFEMGHGP